MRRVQWRKEYQSGATTELSAVTGMAMSADHSQVFVVGDSMNAAVFSRDSFLFVIRSDTGGFVTNVLKITIG